MGVNGAHRADGTERAVDQPEPAESPAAGLMSHGEDVEDVGGAHETGSPVMRQTVPLCTSCCSVASR